MPVRRAEGEPEKVKTYITIDKDLLEYARDRGYNLSAFTNNRLKEDREIFKKGKKRKRGK